MFFREVIRHINLATAPQIVTRGPMQWPFIQLLYIYMYCALDNHAVLLVHAISKDRTFLLNDSFSESVALQLVPKQPLSFNRWQEML